MNQPTANVYSVPAQLRRMENLHILFWLMKDISWCLIWKELGIAMFIPTLSIAIWIAWKNREIASELSHNLAIIFWITANGYWMISEFLEFDSLHLWRQFTYKHLALIPFLTGLLILLHYYLVLSPKEIRKHHSVTM
jgi:hypothetical protein